MVFLFLIFVCLVPLLGRTGRAGAEGKGWLILGPFESLFLEELKKINVPKNLNLIELLNKSALDETDEVMLQLMKRVQGGDQVLNKSGEGAYQAFLGYYLSNMKRIRMKRKETLVGIANEFSASMGFSRVPLLAKNMVNKMGLGGVSGLAIKSSGGGNANNTHKKKNDRSKPMTKRKKRG